MSKRKWMVRIFTVADYEEEEIWLRKQHQNGWKLMKTVPPCFFIFESCESEDVVYRLDFKNGLESGDYLQLFQDYGWEYFNNCMSWMYFRKPVSQADTEQDAEIFSDDLSRVELVDRIVKMRILPLLIIFFACVVPGFVRNLGVSEAFASFFGIMFVLYLAIFLHCGRKLRSLRKKYGK